MVRELNRVICLLTSTVSLCAKLDFNQEVRPILADNCFKCHGPDKKARKAKLRLDLPQGAAQDLGGYRAVEPGKPDESEMIVRITSRDPDEVMPPPKAKKTLTPKQIETLRKWIAEGGEYQRHWAFVKPKLPELPQVEDNSWVRNPIDRFILARLVKEGMRPSLETDKATLLRRVSFDLTGLPPSLRELEEFLADDSPKAFEKAVDRLLSSPRYGEHMAHYWLDAARYADTNGYQYDTHRDMWPWRDWVINAYNRNLPFDRFTIEQLAGDLLTDATLDQKIATGFNRNHPITIEGGVIDEEYRTEYVIDRVTTTAQVWMGMSFLCARCHDHKYDPVPQKEFYQFFAFFNQVPEKGNSGFNPKIKVPAANISRLQAELSSAEQELKSHEHAISVAQVNWEKSLKVETTVGKSLNRPRYPAAREPLSPRCPIFPLWRVATRR
jgi:hypothetical protein